MTDPKDDWQRVVGSREADFDMTREEAEAWQRYAEDIEYRATVAMWLRNQPAKIQLMHDETPGWFLYRVRPGAPYRFTSPYSIVQIDSYKMDGSVGVVVVKRGIGEAAFVKAHVAPQWLERVSVADAFPLAN